MTQAYYNEIDPKAAAWIRELIKRDLVAPGDVDERSIEDITPNELKKYTQCHFFAGVAVWSYSLRQAGWPDDRPCWTGSCPCQPFSAAGKSGGFDDERHLWPAWFHLIDELRPVTIFGEQVSSKDGLTWLDLVSDDLEGADYTLRAVDIPAASVGAPHRRQRLYFVADTQSRNRRLPIQQRQPRQAISEFERGRETCKLDNANLAGSNERPRSGQQQVCNERDAAIIVANNTEIGRRQGSEVAGRSRKGTGTPTERSGLADNGGSSGFVGDTIQQGLEGHGGNERNGHEPGRYGENETRPIAEAGSTGDELPVPERMRLRKSEFGTSTNQQLVPGTQPISSPSDLSNSQSGPTNGFWREADWIYCRDEKYRPVEPGTFPLVTGASARMVRLRGYGNSIVAPQAQKFIESYLEILTERPELD